MGFYRFYYPLGLASMAAVLRENGHDVLVYDAEHPRCDAISLDWSTAAHHLARYHQALQGEDHPIWREMVRVLLEFSPDWIGISMLSVKVPSALKTASLCKSCFPGIPIWVGGDHPTVFPDVVLQNSILDGVVRGEGEETIGELIDALVYGKPIHQIHGLSYRVDGHIAHTPDRKLIYDLNTLAFPAIDSLHDLDTYRPLDLGAVMGSRGCSYPCTFCGVATIWKRHTRFRSVSSIVEELLSLQNSYQVDYFSFRDASFTAQRQRIVDLCQAMIAADLYGTWECVVRCDQLDTDLIGLMKKAGCTTIRIGVESGSESILKSLKKAYSLDDVRRAANMLDNTAMFWSAYFLFGTPRETLQTLRQSWLFMKELSPPFITVARYSPVPGSELYLELARDGAISPYIDWGQENNQNFQSHYIKDMTCEAFESSLKEIAEWVMEHNKSQRNSRGEDSRLVAG